MDTLKHDNGFEKTKEFLFKFNLIKNQHDLQISDDLFQYRWILHDFEFLHQDELKLQLLFQRNFEENLRRGIYFFGCTYDTYEKLYHKRLQLFQNEYPDSSEIDFINQELHLGILQFNFPFIYFETKINIERSLKRRKEFLEFRLKARGYILHYEKEKVFLGEEGLSIFPYEEEYVFHETFKIERDENTYFKKYYHNEFKMYLDSLDKDASKKNIPNLKWNLNKTYLVEVVKGFALTNAFGDSLNEKQLFNIFSDLFNIDIKDHSKILDGMKGRKIDFTIYLNQMITKISDWRNKMDEKKKS